MAAVLPSQVWLFFLRGVDLLWLRATLSNLPQPESMKRGYLLELNCLVSKNPKLCSLPRRCWYIQLWKRAMIGQYVDRVWSQYLSRQIHIRLDLLYLQN